MVATPVTLVDVCALRNVGLMNHSHQHHKRCQERAQGSPPLQLKCYQSQKCHKKDYCFFSFSFLVSSRTTVHATTVINNNIDPEGPGSLNLIFANQLKRAPYNNIWMGPYNNFDPGVEIIKNNRPCFSTSDWRPNFKSLFVHLCLINYWFSQYFDLNRKDYLSLSNRCLR